MPAYHSVYNDYTYKTACGIPIMDFKIDRSPIMDPGKLKDKPDELDIVDEALIKFRANVLFKNFQIKGDADRLLVYITVYISKCLEVAAGYANDLEKTKQAFSKLADDAEWNLNYKAHFLNNLTTNTPVEESGLQSYLKTVRKCVNYRMLYILYEAEWGTLDLKFWLGFAKRKFLGYEMPVIKK
jgi:actin related protein 2/3 complex subunit 3